VDRGGEAAALKILPPPGRAGVPAHWATSTDPGQWNYWRREALAFREGLAQTAYAAAGIRPPDLLDWVDRPDGSVAPNDERRTTNDERRTSQHADDATNHHFTSTAITIW
jgi:hypothetical protein